MTRPQGERIKFEDLFVDERGLDIFKDSYTALHQRAEKRANLNPFRSDESRKRSQDAFDDIMRQIEEARKVIAARGGPPEPSAPARAPKSPESGGPV